LVDFEKVLNCKWVWNVNFEGIYKENKTKYHKIVLCLEITFKIESVK
jgi:hypothetical protein